MKNRIFLMTLLISLFFAGCDLDINNPNSPDEEAIKTYDGLKLLSVGLQSRLSQSVGQMVTVTGAATGESSPVIGYLMYQSIRKYTDDTKRQPLEKDNDYVRLLWRENYNIVKTASDIQKNIPNVSMSDASAKAFTALANVSKVAAFYNLMMCWEKFPINTDNDHPVYVDRATALEECVTLLNSAEQALASAPLPDDFTDNVLGSGIDLMNLVRAYKARIYLVKGEYANAAAAASSVTAESEFVYSESGGVNPLYTHFTRAFYTKAMAYWADDAEAGDARVAEWVDMADGEVDFGDDSVYTIIKYPSETTPYKIYTLDEMTLIKAEAYARGGGGDAVAEINTVRNNAGLADFDNSTTVLEEIFKQRFYELYLTGQHWEDFRRFKDDNITYVNNLYTEQLAHYWFTYPDWEIDKNPNVPPQQTQINL